MMKATIPYIERKFDEYNRRMFGGRLPMPPIVLSDAASFLGQCVSKVKTMPDGSKVYYDFKIRINTRMDLPEHVVEDTIIHEMIHYFIFYNGLRDTSPHGEIFKSLMRSINTHHNRNIAISHKVSAEQRGQMTDTKRIWHIIAVVTMRNGRTGVKVLPRVIPKIADYYTKVSAVSDVASIDLYLHDNPFFNRYPTSAALKIHEIDSSVLQAELKNARKLIFDGHRLIEEKARR